MYYGNNVTGSANLMEVMMEFGVKKIVFSSSATVYGECCNLTIFFLFYYFAQGSSNQFQNLSRIVNQLEQVLLRYLSFLFFSLKTIWLVKIFVKIGIGFWIRWATYVYQIKIKGEVDKIVSWYKGQSAFIFFDRFPNNR